MPKVKGVETLIAKIYRRNALDLSMYAYVRGAQSALHTITVKEALKQFIIDFGLEHEDYSIASALVTFQRMQAELKESKKTK